MDVVFWTLIWKRFACKAFREKKWRKEVTVPRAQVNKIFVIWSSIATYQWQLCLHFTCAMSRTDHQKFMIACCFVNGVVDPLAIVFDSIWFCWRVVVQYGWELQITIPFYIDAPSLSHVYNHRQLLGHGDYDIHDGCCCWVVGGGMTSKISKIYHRCVISSDAWEILQMGFNIYGSKKLKYLSV